MSVLDFRDWNSLAFTRLSDVEDFDSVDNLVSTREDEDCHSVVVRGKLYGPARRRTLWMNAIVKLVLVADKANNAKKLLYELR